MTCENVTNRRYVYNNGRDAAEYIGENHLDQALFIAFSKFEEGHYHHHNATITTINTTTTTTINTTIIYERAAEYTGEDHLNQKLFIAFSKFEEGHYHHHNTTITTINMYIIYEESCQIFQSLKKATIRCYSLHFQSLKKATLTTTISLSAPSIPLPPLPSIPLSSTRELPNISEKSTWIRSYSLHFQSLKKATITTTIPLSLSSIPLSPLPLDRNISITFIYMMVVVVVVLMVVTVVLLW